MKYIILQRANPQDRRKAKWYATPLLERRVRQAELTGQLTQTFGIRYGIVRKIIQVFLEAVVRHLLAGRSVCLRPLGTLRISFTSDGMEEPERVTPDTIRDLKIVITPDKLLKEQLSNLHFELHEAPAAAVSPHESVVEMMPNIRPSVRPWYDPPGTGERPVGAPDHSQGRNPWAANPPDGENPGR